MTIQLKFDQLSTSARARVEQYQNAFKQELTILESQCKNLHPATSQQIPRIEKLFNNLRNDNRWGLKNVTPQGTRIDSPNVQLSRASKQTDPTTPFYDVFDIVDERIKGEISYCKNQIKQAEMAVKQQAPDAEKQLAQWNDNLQSIQYQQLHFKFLRLQAQSLLAETGTLNYVERVTSTLEKVYSGDPNNADYVVLLFDIEQIKTNVEEFSLATENNGVFPIYSSDDVLELRYDIMNEYKEAVQLLDKLNAKGLLNKAQIKPEIPLEDNINFIKHNLETAVDFFKVKNDISYSNPTDIKQKTANREQITSTLEKISMATGAAALGLGAISLIPGVTPGSAPLAGVAGLVSGLTGLAVVSIKTSNAAVNLAQYGALPTKGEVQDLAMAGVSTVISVGGKMGGAVLKGLSDSTSLSNVSLGLASHLTPTEDYKQKLTTLLRDNTVDRTIPSLAGVVSQTASFKQKLATISTNNTLGNTTSAKALTNLSVPSKP